MGYALKPDCPLTMRQLQILSHAASGMTTQGTAYEMGISYDIVQHERSVIRETLACRSTTEAVADCFRKGWLT